MVRKTLSGAGAQVVALFALAAAVSASAIARAQVPELAGVAAAADALLWGQEMPPAARSKALPADAQASVAKYLRREQAFKSTLVRPRAPTFEEGSVFDKRVGIERTIFSLFPRGDSAKVAAQFAMDADLAYEWEGASELPLVEAKAIDRMLADVPGHWLAPYLNLIAGHRRLCAVQMDGPEPKSERDSWARDARRQLTLARNAGHPLIRVVADHLLATGRCVDQ